MSYHWQEDGRKWVVDAALVDGKALDDPTPGKFVRLSRKVWLTPECPSYIDEALSHFYSRMGNALRSAERSSPLSREAWTHARISEILACNPNERIRTNPGDYWWELTRWKRHAAEKILQVQLREGYPPVRYLPKEQWRTKPMDCLPRRN